MYLPIIDSVKQNDSPEDIKSFADAVHQLETAFTPFLSDVDTEPKSADPIRKHNRRHVAKSKTKGTDLHKMLNQSIDDIKQVIEQVERIQNNEDAFRFLYTQGQASDFYRHLPPVATARIYDMAQAYIFNAIQNIPYDSTYFDVEVIQSYSNTLPVLYIHAKPDKLEEVADVRQRMGNIVVKLSPKQKEHNVVLEFYNTSLPSRQILEEKQHKAEAIAQFITAKYSQTTPFWVRCLPQSQQDKWHTFNRKRLNNTYKLIISLKHDLKTFYRNTQVALQTDEVLATRQAIETDLKQYVSAISQAIGLQLDVVVKYTSL